MTSLSYSYKRLHLNVVTGTRIVNEAQYQSLCSINSFLFGIPNRINDQLQHAFDQFLRIHARQNERSTPKLNSLMTSELYQVIIRGITNQWKWTEWNTYPAITGFVRRNVRLIVLQTPHHQLLMLVPVNQSNLSVDELDLFQCRRVVDVSNFMWIMRQVLSDKPPSSHSKQLKNLFGWFKCINARDCDDIHSVMCMACAAVPTIQQSINQSTSQSNNQSHNQTELDDLPALEPDDKPIYPSIDDQSVDQSMIDDQLSDTSEDSTMKSDDEAADQSNNQSTNQSINQSTHQQPTDQAVSWLLRLRRASDTPSGD